MTSRESDSSRVGHRGAWSLPSRRTAPFCPAASPGRTRSRGLARGFIPDLLDRSVLDEILTVGNQAAFDTARALASHPATRSPPRSGSARVTRWGKCIVAVLPSGAERYLSTALFENS